MPEDIIVFLTNNSLLMEICFSQAQSSILVSIVQYSLYRFYSLSSIPTHSQQPLAVIE